MINVSAGLPGARPEALKLAAKLWLPSKFAWTKLFAFAFLRAEREGGLGASVRIRHDLHARLAIEAAAALEHVEGDRHAAQPVVAGIDDHGD